MSISIKTAMKCVKQQVGSKPEHYSIIFLEHIEEGIYDAIEYNFDNKEMLFGFINRG